MMVEHVASLVPVDVVGYLAAEVVFEGICETCFCRLGTWANNGRYWSYVALEASTFNDWPKCGKTYISING
jgi:hypothetical protein